MITVIFKSEKKSKIYNILAKGTCGIYEKGEYIASVKTDDIYLYMQGSDKQDFYAEETILNF